MKRRSFLAGLLAAPLLPHLPKAIEPPAPLDIDQVILDFETYCSADVADSAAFSWAFNTGRVVRFAFPDHPVFPTKTAKFCAGE